MLSIMPDINKISPFYIELSDFDYILFTINNTNYISLDDCLSCKLAVALINIILNKEEQLAKQLQAVKIFASLFPQLIFLTQLDMPDAIRSMIIFIFGDSDFINDEYIPYVLKENIAHTPLAYIVNMFSTYQSMEDGNEKKLLALIIIKTILDNPYLSYDQEIIPIFNALFNTNIDILPVKYNYPASLLEKILFRLFELYRQTTNQSEQLLIAIRILQWVISNPYIVRNQSFQQLIHALFNKYAPMIPELHIYYEQLFATTKPLSRRQPEQEEEEIMEEEEEEEGEKRRPYKHYKHLM